MTENRIEIRAFMPSSMPLASGATARPLELAPGQWPGAVWCESAPAWGGLGLDFASARIIAGNATGAIGQQEQVTELRAALGAPGPAAFDFANNRVVVFNADGTRAAYFTDDETDDEPGDFITELTRQLHTWQDETSWLCPTDVAQMVLSALLTQHGGNPICLGYVALDRAGDVGAGDQCVSCESIISQGVFVAVMSDGSAYGPLCEGCAHSE